MVENSADTWTKEETQKQFHVIAGPSNFINAGRDIARRPPEITRHTSSRAEQSRRKIRRITHSFLRKCQPPACQRIPVATTDRSGRTQCQAHMTGNIEQTTRGQDNKKKTKRSNPFKENQNAWHSIVKALADTAWQCSPLCQQTK